jgi:hypothetical protein
MGEAFGQVAPYAAAGLLGALFGASELIARYRANPFRALGSWAAGGYVLVNATAALTALWLIRAFGQTFGATDPTQTAVGQVVVAGLGSMAFFRSSVITIRGDSGEFGVGPHIILQVFLHALDRGVDRRQAVLRIEAVRRVMAGVTFDEANPGVADTCILALQNLPAEEMRLIGEQIAEIEVSSEPDQQVKAIHLGLILEKWVGQAVLAEAIRMLKERRSA